MEKEILEVEGLSTGYGNNIILQNVSFTVNPNSVLAVVGANGAGKSTLLKTLSGLIEGNTGIIKYYGNRLARNQPHNLIKSGISFFSQGGLIMPALTVEEHLQLAAKKAGRDGNVASFDPVFDQFPRLRERLKSRAGNLSGGERQMLSFGILIVQNTKLWLLDEPTAGLYDPTMVDRTITFLNEKKKEGIAMLLVEHNMRVVHELATDIMMIEEKKLKKFNRLELTSRESIEKIAYN